MADVVTENSNSDGNLCLEVGRAVGASGSRCLMVLQIMNFLVELGLGTGGGGCTGFYGS